jgi:hypothetical protein
MEDVLASGHLITYRGSPAGADTGLRFSERPVPGGGFTCPGCGGVTWPEKEWDDEDDEDDAG